MKDTDYSKYMYLMETIGVLKEKMDQLVHQMNIDPICKQFYFNLGQFYREFEELDDHCALILEDMQVRTDKKDPNFQQFIS